MALNSQTEKAKRFWRLRCEQMLTHNELMETKESEIALLHAQLAAARTPVEGSIDSCDTVVETAQHDSLNELPIPTSRQPDTSIVQPSRKGKAPLVDLFTGESSNVLWEDWFPTLETDSNVEQLD